MKIIKASVIILAVFLFNTTLAQASPITPSSRQPLTIGTYKNFPIYEQERQVWNATAWADRNPEFNSNRVGNCKARLTKDSGDFGKSVALQILSEDMPNDENLTPEMIVSAFAAACEKIGINIKKTSDEIAAEHRFDNITFGQFRTLSPADQYTAMNFASIFMANNTQGFNTHIYISCQYAFGNAGGNYRQILMRNIFSNSAINSKFFDDYKEQAIYLCQENGFRVVDF